MEQLPKELAKLSAAGLALGAPLSLLAAGGYATWATGGDIANVGFGTIFDYMPPAYQLIPYYEPFFTSLKVGAAAILATTVAVPAVAFRPKNDSYGKAEWQSRSDIKKAGMAARLRDLNAPIFAKLGGPRGNGLYVTGQGEPQPHSLIIAPTRGGKGAGIVIPTLLTYLGSIVCVDIKGENYRHTARIRAAMGNEVFKIEPYNAEGKTHCFNPMELVIAARPRFRWAAASDLAACLLANKGASGSSDWLGGCRLLFAAAALLAIERDTPTISAIYDMFTEPDDLPKVLRRLGNEALNPEAKRVFNQFSGYEDEQLSSYFSIMNDAGLGLWNDPLVRDVTSKSDFSITDLRSNPASIYLVISQGQLARMAPLVRVLFQQIINQLSLSEPDVDAGEIYSVLFVLDEFRSLGHMDSLLEAITAVGGHGGRLMIVIQNLANLYENYGRFGAETFISNSDIQVYMSPNDKETPEYLSSSIGDYTRSQRSKSWKGGDLATSYQERQEGARLIRPEEIKKLGREQVLILVRGMSPIKTNRVSYFKDRNLAPIWKNQSGEFPDPPVLPDDYEEAYAANLAKLVPSPPHLDDPATVDRSHTVEDATASDDPDRTTEKPPEAEPAVASPNTDAVSDSGHPDDNMDAKTETRVENRLTRMLTMQEATLEGTGTYLAEMARRNKRRSKSGNGASSDAAPEPENPDEDDAEELDAGKSAEDITALLNSARDANGPRLNSKGPA